MVVPGANEQIENLLKYEFLEIDKDDINEKEPKNCWEVMEEPVFN